MKKYTMVEILVVISIIVILAAMTLAAAGYLMRMAAEKKTRAAIKSVEMAIGQYMTDKALIPSQTTFGGDPVLSWYVLEKEWTDTNGNGKRDYDVDQFRWYVDPVNNDLFRNVEKQTLNGHDLYIILDAFDERMYYRSPGVMNTGSFDVWSKGYDQAHGNNGSSISDAETVSEDSDDITNWKRGM